MSVNGKINGWTLNAKTVIAIIFSIVSIGIWVGTIQADVEAKAEKLDVATQQAALAQTLRNIDDSLRDIKESINRLDARQEKFDERQRQIKEDVAKLKAKQE